MFSKEITVKNTTPGKKTRIVKGKILWQAIAVGMMVNVSHAWAVQCFRSESDWSQYVAYPKTITFEDQADGTVVTNQYAPDVTFTPLEGQPVAVETFGSVMVSPINGIHIGGPDSAFGGGDASVDFGDGLEGVGIWYNDSQTKEDAPLSERNAMAVYTKAGPGAPEVETEVFPFEDAEFQNRFVGCVISNPAEGVISRIELRSANWDRVAYDNLRYAKPCRHSATRQHQQK